MENKRLLFRIHALQRMFERRITIEEVRLALETGETIESYLEDRPYPSRLVLGWVSGRPLHVVIADNQSENTWIVITVYEPDPGLWEDNFRRRKR